jgi:hypothetical protein
VTYARANAGRQTGARRVVSRSMTASSQHDSGHVKIQGTGRKDTGVSSGRWIASNPGVGSAIWRVNPPGPTHNRILSTKK